MEPLPLQPKPTKRRAGLAAARIAAGLTQEDLAEQLDVERTTVYRWESGESTPRPWIRPKLAKLLGLDNRQLAALLDGASYESIRTASLSSQPPSPDQPRTDSLSSVQSTFPAIPNANDDAAASGSSDELAILATASLALLGAITSGNVASKDQTSEQLTDLDRLMDMMKRRGILHLLGQLATGGVLASPALGGLRHIGALDLNPDEQERIAQAVVSPERVDEHVIGHIETMLWACQRQDDTFGPQVVLNAVLDQRRLVHDVLLPACPDHLLPRMLSLYSNLRNSAGWYFFDLNNFERAWQEFEQGRKAAHEAQNTELSIFTLLNMSYVTAWHGQTHMSVDFAMAAQGLAVKTDDALLRVCVSADTAASYAADRQYHECMSELDKAQTIFTASSAGVPSESVAYQISPGYLANAESLCMLRLNKPGKAIVSARTGLELFDRSFTRSLAFCHLRLGNALTKCKEIDEAATTIAEAATFATQNRSTRLVKELHTTRAAMQPWQETRAVRELDEQLVGLGLGGAI